MWCDVVCAAHTMGLRRQEGQRGSVSCERTDSASSSHNTSTGVNFITQPVLRHLKMLKSVWEESHRGSRCFISPLTDVMPQDSMCPSPANAQRRRDSHHRSALCAYSWGTWGISAMLSYDNIPWDVSVWAEREGKRNVLHHVHVHSSVRQGNSAPLKWKWSSQSCLQLYNWWTSQCHACLNGLT